MPMHFDKNSPRTAAVVRQGLVQGVSDAQMTARENINSLIRMRGAKGTNRAATQVDVMVHGTLARDEPWSSATGQFANRIRSQRAALGTRFEWSGARDENSRQAAGKQLSSFLKDLSGDSLYMRRDAMGPQRGGLIEGHRGVNVIAHSHGGNVLGHALNQRNTPAIQDAFLLGTPSMYTQRRDNVSWSNNSLNRVTGRVHNLYSNWDPVQQGLAQQNENLQGSGFSVRRRLEFPHLNRPQVNHQNIAFNPMSDNHASEPNWSDIPSVHSELHNQRAARYINYVLRQGGH